MLKKNDVLLRRGIPVAAPLLVNLVKPTFLLKTEFGANYRGIIRKRYYKPVPEMWDRLLQRLTREENDRRRAFAERQREFKSKVLEGDAKAVRLYEFLCAFGKYEFETEYRPTDMLSVGNFNVLNFCEQCGEIMVTRDRIAKYCSERCRKKYQQFRAEFRARHRSSRAKPKTSKACGHCGKTFTPKRSDAKYCSTRCRVAGNRALQKSS